jgi:tetratricopeptide (TPR) repeat protein
MLNRAAETVWNPLEANVSPWKRVRRSPDAVIFILLFASTLSIHLVTAARTVTFSDSGDFLMAISTVGNAHGPGYPLYLMLSKIFTWIFPFGSLAFRVSALSGVFAALATCLIYWAVFKMTHSRVGGVAAGLAYAFSYTFWYETVIPESYALGAFFIALLIVLALRWERLMNEGERSRADNTIAAFAFVFGLSVTNHYSGVFVIPAFFFFAVDTNWRELLAPRNIFRIAAFFALGLLPYIYEPTAAFRGPAYNYGDPSTLTRWFHHITLYYQRGGLFGYPLKFFPGRFARFFGTLLTEYPYFFWLAAVGVVASFLRKSKKYALFLVLLFLLTALTVMSYDQLESVLRAHFYYPSYLVVSLWIGFGAAWFATVVRKWAERRDKILRSAALGLVAVILIALVCVSIPVHYGKVDKSQYYYARDMAVKMLTKAEPDGLILTDADNVVFPLKYMQTVEGVGANVRVINPHSLGVPGWPGQDLNRTIAPPGVQVGPDDLTYMRLIKLNYQRIPVYSSGLTFVLRGWSQQWEGLLLRVAPPGTPVAKSPAVVLHKGKEPLADLDSDAREAIGLPEILKAYIAVNDSDLAAASRLYAGVTDYGEKDLYVPTLYGCETLSSVFDLWAQVLNQLGDFQRTVKEMPRALTVNPNFVSVAYAHALTETGDYAAAIQELDQYITVNSGAAIAFVEKGEAEILLGQFSDAVVSLRKAVELDPNDPKSRYDLGVALYRSGDKKGAKEQFKAAVQKGPQTQYGTQSQQLLQTLKF